MVRAARISHKEADKFIRKYNNQMAIKNYSNLAIAAKRAAIERHVNKVGGPIKQEWVVLKRSYAAGVTTQRRAVRTKAANKQITKQMAQRQAVTGKIQRKATARKPAGAAAANAAANILAGMTTAKPRPRKRKKPPRTLSQLRAANLTPARRLRYAYQLG